MPLSTSFTEAFSRLTAAWTRHQELRDGDASIEQLASSRRDLDRARLECTRMRVY